MKPLFYIATANAHKLAEFKEMFAECGFDCELKSASDVADFESPDENGTTFEENAFIKAEALRRSIPEGAWVFADDSGIVVDALGGAPGIHSARYAGASGKNADRLNNEKLLRELENVPDPERTARFVCVIALIAPDGKRFAFCGKIEGVINRGEAGLNGFGYDPLFYLPDLNSTTAQLPSGQKNAISHRGAAFKLMVAHLKSLEL